MTEERRREWPLHATLAAMFVASALVWTRVPERMAVHWNAAGEVDRWGGRAEGLLAVPIAALGLHLLLRFIPRIDPGRENYENFAGPYRAFRLAFLLFLAAIHAILVAVALGARLDVLRLALAASGGLLVALGAVSGKVRPNWFIGIRTRWSLSSKRSWDRANRLSGWLYVLAGIAIVATALLWPDAAIFTLLLGAIAPAVAGGLCSWWVWRSDPDRTPPAGTRPA